MSYYIRYFADQPVTSKAIHQALQALDPTFKIDLGELIRGETALGQIEVNQAQGDLFEDDLGQTLRMIQASGHGHNVMARLQAARSIVVVSLDWSAIGSEAALAMVAPLWTALAHLSTGLSQWEGNGVFDGGDRVVDLSAVR